MIELSKSKEMYKLFTKIGSTTSIPLSFIQKSMSTKIINTFSKTVKQTVDVVDGCFATAYIAYAFSENSFIYPITPSSAMADKMD